MLHPPRDSFAERYGTWGVVAGASEGFGAAFAAQLAERGMHLVLLARRAHLLTTLAGDLTSRYGIEVRCLALDLADAASIGTLADAVAGLEVGVFIYNAACIPVGPFLDIEDDEIAGAVNVNVRGPLRMLRALVPGMCDRGRGAVVLVSSLSGLQGTPHVSVYAATKAFNIALAEGLWWELRAHGVEVAVCCAGAMRTPGYARSFNRDVPGMLSPDDAARRTLDGLGGGPRIVPGLINRLSAQLLGRLLPRRTAIRLIARSTRHIAATGSGRKETR